MSVDPAILNAMAQSVERDPDSVPLRLHYAGLLLTAGMPQDALSQYTHVLAKQPDHLEALQKAAEAADMAGDAIRAHSYRNLHQALSWNRTKDLIESATPDTDPFQVEPEPERLRASVDGAEGDEPLLELVQSDLTLADVAGLEEVKRRLHLSFLGPMRNPDLRKLYGKSLKGGLLLYGPPGCGKTYLARAVAGELGAMFLSVGLTDVVDMWIGQSEKNLHAIFESARRNRPCVVFFDEIDAIGRKRSLMREHAGRTLINQLLAEMDGVQFDNEGVYVLAATNHPWDVDAALRRPGRLDRTLLVLPPDKPAREAIFRMNLQDRPVEKIDFAWLADKTEDYSGADIAHVCDSAAELALEASITSGVTRPITMKDLQQALKDAKPSLRPWFESARNYALYANDGGSYDELLDYLRKRRML